MNASKTSLFLTDRSSLKGFAGPDGAPARPDSSPYVSLSAIAWTFTSERALHQIGWYIVKIARRACFLKQMNVVRDASEAILGLPLPDEIRNIGHYYKAHRAR
ncbi:MAG TPA: hypothetical protein VN345_02155 [Blastocatellia bacterium]|nr:hypothetical protein [Blastocatellia bacterium]